MIQGGGSITLTPPTPPNLPHSADDSSGVSEGSAKLPQAQLTPVSSHVDPSTLVVKEIGSAEEGVPTIPRADTSAKGVWRPTRRLANLSTVATKVVDDTVDYIKMHSVSVHKMGNASEFPGPELGLTQNCSPVHNTKCTLL